jgi:hypothetical protein
MYGHGPLHEEGNRTAADIVHRPQRQIPHAPVRLCWGHTNSHADAQLQNEDVDAIMIINSCYTKACTMQWRQPVQELPAANQLPQNSHMAAR